MFVCGFCDLKMRAIFSEMHGKIDIAQLMFQSPKVKNGNSGKGLKYKVELL
ncbi:hypothetical protein MASR2M47_15210 [Draconibacterium sp.]